MVSRRVVLYAAIIFIVAFASRSIIFLRAGFPTGDAGQFATFVSEFERNGGWVPATNTLYYPGSTYIYPPLIFLCLSFINLTLGHFIHLPAYMSIYELFYLAIAVSSIQTLFLALYFRKFQNRVEFLLTAGLLVLFDASLYEMSWGGYPDIIALLSSASYRRKASSCLSKSDHTGGKTARLRLLSVQQNRSPGARNILPG